MSVVQEPGKYQDPLRVQVALSGENSRNIGGLFGFVVTVAFGTGEKPIYGRFV